MSRTDKQGIRRSKEAQAKSSRIKGLDRRPLYIAIARKKLEQLKTDGHVVSITNPLGNTYFWFNKGRKSCEATRLKIDPDGYGKFGNKVIAWYTLRRLHKSKRK